MATRARDLYREDFYAWTRDQAAALRELQGQRWNGPLDLEHLAEEIEDLGSEVRWGIESHIERVIEHLLKLESSPSAEPRRGWLVSVRSARSEIGRRLTRAIRREIQPELGTMFDNARYNAAQALAEDGEMEAARSLPLECPYTLDHILDRDFIPANRHGVVDEPI
jgi:DNA-binding PucR family transcriptional regulator